MISMSAGENSALGIQCLVCLVFGAFTDFVRVHRTRTEDGGSSAETVNMWRIQKIRLFAGRSGCVLFLPLAAEYTGAGRNRRQ